jgi:hypothetical protein
MEFVEIDGVVYAVQDDGTLVAVGGRSSWG